MKEDFCIEEEYEECLKENERLHKSLEEQRHFYLGEIERLNNIINEYEKWLKAHLDEEFYWFKMYDKLQELKGDSSNGK